MAVKKGSKEANAKAKKAWATRRANIKAASAGARLIKAAHEAVMMTKNDDGWKATAAPEGLTLYEQLDNELTKLENRLMNTIARIKSLGV